MSEVLALADDSNDSEVRLYRGLVDEALLAFTGNVVFSSPDGATVEQLYGQPGLGVKYACQVTIVTGEACLVHVEDGEVVVANITLADGRSFSLLHNVYVYQYNLEGEDLEEQVKVSVAKIKHLITLVFGHIKLASHRSRKG